MSQGVVQNTKDRAAHKRFKANKPTNLVAAPTYINSSMTERYLGNNMQSPRADANDRAHASLPMTAQIQRSQA